MKENTLYFEKLANFPRVAEPVACTIPFAIGQADDGAIEKLAVYDANGPVATQAKVLGSWPDGTAKWVKVAFLADLPANGSKTYEYDFTGRKAAAGAIRMAQNDLGLLEIDNGCLKIALNNAAGKRPFALFEHGDFCLEEEAIDGPYMVGESGKRLYAQMKSEWEVQERGEVFVKLRSRGVHRDAGEDGFSFTLTLLVYAGAPWVEIQYRLMNTLLERPAAMLHESALDILPKGAGASFALATSNYRSNISLGTGSDTLEKMIDAEFLLYEANEQDPEVLYGTFFADWTDPVRGGVCATIYQAQQNYPKRLEVSEEALKVQLLPAQYGGIEFARGMAKTHTMFLHFHGPDASIEEINLRSLMLQCRDRPIISQETYEKSGVFRTLFVKNRSRNIDYSLSRMIDDTGRALGMLNWGDYPDKHYSSEGRGRGEPVWLNNEYDFPYMAMQLYARTGERRHYERMLAAAAHWMDVDICHCDPDPLRRGAQVAHCAGHVHGKVNLSHQWVEGLFAYYYATGETLAYEAALGIGENILRRLDTPYFKKVGQIHARDTGWALRALLALYRETNDPRWMEKTDFIIGHFIQWKEAYGGWLSPYTDHMDVRVPFMIAIAAVSLMRYYDIRPSEEIKQMILSAVDDMVDHCLLDSGLFYYKELPSARRNADVPCVLEALAFAYELTGNDRYLRAGTPTLLAVLESGLSGPMESENKYAIKDSVIMEGHSPKLFAISFSPVSAFYYHLSSTSWYTTFCERHLNEYADEVL